MAQEKQAVCLCMIVRNEAHVIERCLASVKPLITHWAIVDTGSTDDTREVIRRVLGDLPGRLITEPWTDFSTARNQSLELGREVLGHGAGYLLTLDADETLECEPGFELPELTHDSYALAFQLDDTDQVWARRAFYNAQRPWKYVGIIHEHPVCDVEDPTTAGIPGLYAHSRTDGARSKLGKTEKAKRDLATIRKALKAEPDSSRLQFYLGQTLAACQKIDEAIEAYEKRATMGGFDEEVYHSIFQVACLREYRGDHIDDVRLAYLRAYEARPTRAEPLFALAVLHNDHDMPATAELYARAACGKPRPGDALIVTESVYEWRSPAELALALLRQGKLAEAIPLSERLLEHKGLPEQERADIERNLNIARQQLAEAEAA